MYEKIKGKTRFTTPTALSHLHPCNNSLYFIVCPSLYHWF